MKCGVPQGSILSPVFFNIYILPLADICQKHIVYYHLHADDTQLYLPLKVGASLALHSLFSCLNDNKNGMAASFPHLNESKTGLIELCPLSLFKDKFNSFGIFIFQGIQSSKESWFYF